MVTSSIGRAVKSLNSLTVPSVTGYSPSDPNSLGLPLTPKSGNSLNWNHTRLSRLSEYSLDSSASSTFALSPGYANDEEDVADEIQYSERLRFLYDRTASLLNSPQLQQALAEKAALESILQPLRELEASRLDAWYPMSQAYARDDANNTFASKDDQKARKRELKKADKAYARAKKAKMQRERKLKPQMEQVQTRIDSEMARLKSYCAS